MSIELFFKVIINIYFLININYQINIMGIGDWGLGIGDWGLDPIPKPQKPKTQTQPPKKINKKNI